MRNTKTVVGGAEWALLYSDTSGSLAIGISPHNPADEALIVPVSAALLHALGMSMIEHAAERFI